MATVIKTIEDFFHNKVYPKTKTKAVYDDNNNRLDNILASKQDVNSNFVYKGTGSATPSIDDPELRQSDISTTQSTSDITVPSSSLVKTMNDNLGNPSSASSVTGADAFSKISTLNSDLVDEEITSQCTFHSSVVIGGQWGGHVYKNKAQRVIYGNIHAEGTLSNGTIILELPSNIHSAIVGDCGMASYNIQGTMATGLYVTSLGDNKIRAYNNNNTYNMDSPAFMFRLPYTET